MTNKQLSTNQCDYSSNMGIDPWYKNPNGCPSVEPTSNICNHTFALWMVIPPQGATIQCPICRSPRFIQGTQITW
jgi:hypothetical protein